MDSLADEESDLEMDHDWHFKYNRRLSNFSHSVTSLEFSQDGKLLVTGTGNGFVNVWDTGCWGETGKLKTNRREEARAIVFSPAQRWLVATYSSVLNIFRCSPPWSLEQAISPMPDPLTKEPSKWYCVAFSPMAEVDHPKGSVGQDNHLACFSKHHLVVLDYSGGWGADTPKRTRSIPSNMIPNCLAYTASGWWIVVGFDTGQVQVWNAFSLTLERTMSGHTGLVTSLSSSPRNAMYDPRVVSTSVDQSLRVWQECGWVLEQICPDVKCDSHGVRSCTFSSNGEWLVSVANELCVWRVCISRRGKMNLRMHQRLSASCGSEALRSAACCCLNDAVAVGSRDGVLGLFTKNPGRPADQRVVKELKDPAALSISRATSASSSVTSPSWGADALALARPMQRIRPDGGKKLGQLQHAASSPVGRDWFQRTHLRSINVPALRVGIGGKNFSPSAGSCVTVGSPLPSPSGDGAAPAALIREMASPQGIERSKSSSAILAGQGDQSRWKRAGSGFEIDGFVRDDNEKAARKDGQDSLELDTPLRRTIRHRCRTLVARIALEPESIPG